MRVVVTGGTGFIGTALCRELDERGHDVVAVSRTPGDADLPEGIETQQGDVTDPPSIERTLEGADTVVNLVALSPLYKPRGGPQMHDRVHHVGTANVIAAARATGVKRIVQMSSVSADPDAPTAYLRAKGRAEEAVQSSELDWVIFRPAVVFGDGGEFLRFVKRVAPPYITPLPGGGTSRFQPIWIEDFVPMIADAAVGPSHVGEIYEIGGAEMFTLAELAKLGHAADGRPVNVIPIPMPLMKIGMTIGGYIPRFPFGQDQYRALQMDLIAPANDVDAFGVSPEELRRLSAYLGVEDTG